MAFAAVPLLSHESGIEQDTQVLRNRRAAHRKLVGQRTDRTVRLREQIEHVPPRGMADRPEHIGHTMESHRHAASIRKTILTRQVLR